MAPFSRQKGSLAAIFFFKDRILVNSDFPVQTEQRRRSSLLLLIRRSVCFRHLTFEWAGSSFW